jgi:hypothetical protein
MVHRLYGLKTAAAPAPLSGPKKHHAVDEARKRARAHSLDMAARGPEAFPGNEALDFALD